MYTCMYLVMKEKYETSAKEVFADTDAYTTTHGKQHLGAALPNFH